MSAINMVDAFVVDKRDMRRTRDGYLVASPRVARVGIQDYLGHEVGRPDLDRVKVYRPAEEVFAPDSVKSYAHRPVTNDHPPVPVTDKNWKKYAVGQTSDSPLRDGDFLRVPLMVADAAAIEDVESGDKVELSNGYSTELDWTPGVAPDGATYDAVQRTIRSNHIALVKRARGGDKLRVGDARVADDFVPGLHPRVPPGSPTGGQFTSKGEAEGFIAENRRRWKRATVEKVIETRSHVAPGVRGWLGLKEKTKKERYVIKTDAAGLKTCSKCGYRMPAAAKECPECGHQVTDSAELLGAADRVSDAEGNNHEGEEVMAKLTIDGVSCEMPDLTAQIVQRALDQSAAKLKEVTDKAAEIGTVQAQVATLTTQVATKDAEIVTLKKAVEDAKPSALQLDQMVAERTTVISKGKQLIGDKLVLDGKTAPEIRRQVVDTLLGDVSKGWTDDQVTASFAVVAASVSDKDGTRTAIPGVTDVAAGFSRPASHSVDAADAAYASYEKDYLKKGRAA